MDVPLKPIYLFADSSLLFWREKDMLFLNSVRSVIEKDSPKAAYIGASNGDNPDYYQIFEAAMDSIGVTDRKMILSSYTTEDASFLDQADIILLSGGDVEVGWGVFTRTGLKETILKRYYEGSVLIGISAGAIQLGLLGLAESSNDFVETFKLIPFVIGVHEEATEWESLKESIRRLNSAAPAIGIPSGGGIVAYADGSIEPIRHPGLEFSLREGRIIESLLVPGITSNIIYSNEVN
jgi:cyanophycinase